LLDCYHDFAESAIWSTVTTAGAGPSARFSMAGDCLDPVRSGVLVFVGGCNGNLEALDDMYYLHTGSKLYLVDILLVVYVDHQVFIIQYVYLSLFPISHLGLTREHQRRLDKLPLRKKQKLKCQEQNLTLGHENALVQVGVSTSSYQPVPQSIYGQPGQALIYVSFHVLK